MTNLLVNGGMEGGWTRKTHTGQEFGEIFVPEGWTAFWREDGEVPHDPSNTNGYGRPEMHVINREAPYLDPPRIRSGLRSAKLFTFYRIHDAGYYQQVPVLTGERVRLTGWAHAWTSTHDDPRVSEHAGDAAKQAVFQVGIDPEGGTDPWGLGVIWGSEAGIYDAFAQIPAIEVTAQWHTVTAFVRSTTLYPFKHCDAYLDDMSLEVVATVDPEPPIEPTPGVAYVVVVNLLPQDTTKVELAIVLEKTYAQKQTLLYSDQDAARLVAPGLPGSYVTVWNPERWTHGDIVQVLEDRGVGDVRKAWFVGPPVEPVDPQGGEPSPFDVRSDNLIGLHSGFVRAQSRYYLEQSGTAVQKWFSAGDCYKAKQWAPDCLMFWRKFVDALPYGAVVDQATWYAQQYQLELATASAALGITVDQLLAAIDGMESFNELIPSHNQVVVEYAVAFDVAFADALYALYGNKAHPVLLNGAVGNPHESEVILLLPAARAAVKYGGYVGYHSYWPANETGTWVAEKWQWFAGRWAEWDKVFTAAGVYPRYISTESGLCYSPDGEWLDPSSGWKKAGSFERYLADISEYNRRALEWNKAHANRFAGMTLFGYGNWGWTSFELGDGEVMLLKDWAVDTDPQHLAMLTASHRVDYWDQFDEDDYHADLQEYLDTALYITPEYRTKLEEIV